MLHIVFGLFFIFCTLFSQVRGDFSRLQQEDIRPTMQEILAFHVESRKITPKIMQRAIKNFLLRFDPGKVYLKQSEVAPFLNLSSQELKKMIQQYESDDLDSFLALNQVIQHSISRSRIYREEIIRELILQKNMIVLPSQETYLHFSKSNKELRRRIKNELVRFVMALEKDSSKRTPARKELIVNFFLKRVSRNEKPFEESEGQDRHQLVVHTLKAMAKSLDAHTAFYTPQEAVELRTTLEKEFEGVGVVLKEDMHGVAIANLVKGGPAERSGKIYPGDRLYKVNSSLTEALSYDEILSEMKKGKKVTLGVRHSDDSEESVTLKKERIELTEERVKYSFIPFGNGMIGKIELPSFYGSSGQSSSEKDMLQALRELKKKGKMLGLVIDLRENSGGFLSEAVKVASLFVKSGVIVVSKYSGGEVQYLRDVDPRVHYDGPLLILTSQASASAAEIVAQALQDYGLALVVGDKRTYGKGSIQYQTITTPTAKIFFKVTVGRYYTVSGRSTQIDGVKADIVVPTHYSAFKIGERYLDYPLSSDHIDSAFVDPLVDIQDDSLRWFQKYYLPNLQKRTSYWRQMIPPLEKNSRHRIATNIDYQLFLQALKKEPTKGNWGKDDLQMAEALEILRDMIILHQEKTK